MAQYISKDALLVEIERLKDEYLKHSRNKFYAEWSCGTLDNILSFVETLEVKEVDLNRELDDYIEKERAWIKDDRSVEYNNGDSFNHIYDLRELAEHFFELGLKVQENQNLDDIKRKWYNKGYLKGRKEAHIPARELGLPKVFDFKPLDADLERDAVSFCFDNGLNTTPHIAKTIAKHFFELGMQASNKTQKGEEV